MTILNIKINKLVKSYFPIMIIFIASIVAISHHIISGHPRTYNGQVNFQWYRCFTEQLYAGEIYPRWLFNYQDGFGAPVFYFYAPIPFYLLSLLDAIFVNYSSGLFILTIGHWVIFFLSGVTFFIFISLYIDKSSATITSLLYMFLPYHFIDLVIRGSLGEAFVYIWVPLIMIGICHHKKNWQRLLFSAFCYAGVILSHLPSALLLAPVVLFFSLLTSDRSQWMIAFGYALLTGIIGVALSSFYLIPAITMLDTIPYDAWVTGSGKLYHPTTWLIGSSEIPRFGYLCYSILAATSLIGLVALYYIFKDRNTCKVKCRGLITSSLISLIVCWFLLTNLSKPVWVNLPILSKVQFPWRLGVIIDFCSILLFGLALPNMNKEFSALTPARFGRKMINKKAVLCSYIAFIAITEVIIMYHRPLNSKDLSEGWWPIEYRPKSMVESNIYSPSDNMEGLADIASAHKLHATGLRQWKNYVNPLPPIQSLRELEHGEKVRIDSTEIITSTIYMNLISPAKIRLRKIYYPHWRILDDAGKAYRISADKKTGLLLFELPAGEHKIVLKRCFLPSEKTGFIISAITIIIIGCGVAIRKLRK